MDQQCLLVQEMNPSNLSREESQTVSLTYSKVIISPLSIVHVDLDQLVLSGISDCSWAPPIGRGGIVLLHL